MPASEPPGPGVRNILKNLSRDTYIVTFRVTGSRLGPVKLAKLLKVGT